jgi:hypothetical protein
MKKAKPNKRVAAPVKHHAKCPVLPIALRVGELWDAHAGAEEREYGKSDADISEQIYKMRTVVEETASFERARSLSGALFQVALAHDAANHLYELVPSEKLAIESTFDKLIRLLDSVGPAIAGRMHGGGIQGREGCSRGLSQYRSDLPKPSVPMER